MKLRVLVALWSVVVASLAGCLAEPDEDVVGRSEALFCSFFICTAVGPPPSGCICADDLLFDTDGDTVADGVDRFPGCNDLGADADGDGVPDDCDVCPGVAGGFVNCNIDAENHVVGTAIRGDVCDPNLCPRTRPQMTCAYDSTDLFEVDAITASAIAVGDAVVGHRFCSCSDATGDDPRLRQLCEATEGCTIPASAVQAEGIYAGGLVSGFGPMSTKDSRRGFRFVTGREYARIPFRLPAETFVRDFGFQWSLEMDATTFAIGSTTETVAGTTYRTFQASGVLWSTVPRRGPRAVCLAAFGRLCPPPDRGRASNYWSGLPTQRVVEGEVIDPIAPSFLDCLREGFDRAPRGSEPAAAEIPSEMELAELPMPEHVAPTCFYAFPPCFMADGCVLGSDRCPARQAVTGVLGGSVIVPLTDKFSPAAAAQLFDPTIAVVPMSEPPALLRRLIRDERFPTAVVTSPGGDGIIDTLLATPGGLMQLGSQQLPEPPEPPQEPPLRAAGAAPAGPGERIDHGVVYWGGLQTLIVAGGTEAATGTPRPDVWAFALQLREWRQIPLTGAVRPQRVLATALDYTNARLFILDTDHDSPRTAPGARRGRADVRLLSVDLPTGAIVLVDRWARSSSMTDFGLASTPDGALYLAASNAGAHQHVVVRFDVSATGLVRATGHRPGGVGHLVGRVVAGDDGVAFVVQRRPRGRRFPLGVTRGRLAPAPPRVFDSVF